MYGKLRRAVANFLLRNLFVAVTSDRLLAVTAKKTKGSGLSLRIGDALLADDASMRLGQSARELVKNDAFRLIIAHARQEAKIMMFERSKVDADLFFGKAMLYDCDVIEKKAQELTKL